MNNIKKNAIIYTLGCRLNSADSALLTDRLERANFAVVESVAEGESVELIIINSCSVTAEAARKSRKMARTFRAKYPLARIVATGCSAELDRAAWLDDGVVDAVISNPEKRSIEEFCAEVAPVSGVKKSLEQGNESFSEHATGSFPFRSRAFLKIQEGCENFCTYCIVPYARGPERSRNFEEVLQDCQRSLDSGFTELVLTGVNTATYRDNGRDLGDLVSTICNLSGDFRVRLSSTEPHPSNLQLLEVLRDNPKVCRFLHLSLQHGADRILQRMNRKYSAKEYAHFVATAKEMIPGISIGTDVIVGFPGETNEDFEISRNFIRDIGFANTHLFSYSPRQGTPAATFPDQVHGDIVKKRFALLRAEADIARKNFIREMVGLSVPVIFEEIDSNGYAVGWSDNYIHIRRPANTVELRKIVPVTVIQDDITLLT